MCNKRQFQDGIDQIDVSGYGITSFGQLNITDATNSVIDFDGVNSVTVNDMALLTLDDFIFA